jgi:hypothetical protein
MRSSDLKEQVDQVQATRKNTCKIPTQPYGFLKEPRQIFTLDNSFHENIYEKYKEAIWKPVIENTRQEVLERVGENLQELSSFSDLLDPHKLDLLDGSLEQLVNSFGDSGIGIFAVVAGEYRKQAKARLYIDHEKRFLRYGLNQLNE